MLETQQHKGDSSWSRFYVLSILLQKGDFMPRYFTLQEANESLNTIRSLMDEVQKIRQKILANQPEAWPAIEKSAGNGCNPETAFATREHEGSSLIVV